MEGSQKNIDLQKNKQSKNQIILDLSFIYGFIKIYGASTYKSKEKFALQFFLPP